MNVCISEKNLFVELALKIKVDLCIVSLGKESMSLSEQLHTYPSLNPTTVEG